MSPIFKSMPSEFKSEKKDPSFSSSIIRPIETPSLKGVKLSILLSFLLSIIALGGSAALYQTLNNERDQRKALEASQDQIREKATSFETTSEQYRAEIERMREQLKGYATARESFQKEIEADRQQIAELQKQLKTVQEKSRTIDDLAAKLKAKEAVTSAVPTAFIGPEKPPAPAVAAAATSTTTIKTPAPAAATPAPAKNSQILTVNRKFNFVVVNVGIRDGVKMGDNLKVMRAGKEVGAVQIEKLYENFSAANIVKEPKNDPFKEGDVIRKS